MNPNQRRALTWLAAGMGAFFAARAAVRWYCQYDLRGKVALITGGSRGLGLVLARELARQGARVAICARNEPELRRAVEDLRGRGAEVLAVECDLADRGQIDDLVRQVSDHWGGIDVLINNAGVIQTGPMETMTLEDYEESMKVHFWAPLCATLAVLPQMRRRKSGRIVNISSIGGKISVPHLLPYCASKFALVGLSEGLRAELAKDGIAVTTVCPGMMRTGSPRNAFFKGQHRDEYAWFSISDSLPLMSVNADRAARQIVAACRHGEAELTLTAPAKVAVRLHGLFPGATSAVLGWVNRLLPAPGGIGTERAAGSESQSNWSPSWLTALTDKAAARNNQLGW
jgi:NAD(P)-dependent dehydrogenase (short-subunit alcohol dehydrogenase family)